MRCRPRPPPSTKLSGAADTVHRRAGAGRAGAARRAEDDRKLGAAGRGRPASRGGRDHRGGHRGEVGAGRLHAAAHDRRVHDQRDVLPEAPVQPRARSRAGRPAREDLVHRGGESVGAGEIDAGARSARAREAGRAQLRAFGPRHDGAPRLRNAEGERRHRHRSRLLQGRRARDHRRDRRAGAAHVRRHAGRAAAGAGGEAACARGDGGKARARRCRTFRP